MEMGARLAKIRDRVFEIAVAYMVSDVSAEQYNIGPRKRSRAAQTFYLHGQVGLKLWENGFPPPLMIAPGTLKKWTTGDGSAEKEDIRFSLEKLLNTELHPDHNVVDGVALAVMLMQRHLAERGKFAPTKYQLEKMKKWQRML